MEVNDLIRVLSAGPNLAVLLNILASDCLNNRSRVAWDKHLSDSDATHEARREAFAASQIMWDGQGNAQGAPTSSLIDALRPLESTPDLATLTVLEGLCHGAARIYFARIFGPVTIQRGMVLPLPDRRVDAWPTTPNPATTRATDLLDPACGFVIWDHDWELELDFTDRERIDALCWPPTGPLAAHQLPRIATVHPFRGHEMAPPDVQESGRFFGVHPQTGPPPTPSATENAVAVMHALSRLQENGPAIAIVPEFTMHSPHAIAAYLRDHSDEVPSIVVAGTAHHVDDGVRANTSVTYLDGVEILRVSKQHPFSYRIKATTEADGDPRGAAVERYLEDVAPRPRRISVVASSSTRLTVAICSDLNSQDLATLLAAAGINLLLAPAWTPKIGTFRGAIAMLAAYSQCVSVIANTPGHPSAEAAPFWALSMTPHETAAPTSHHAAEGSVAVVIDPNHEPATSAPYVQWVPWI